jgi:transposase-like protein
MDTSRERESTTGETSTEPTSRRIRTLQEKQRILAEAAEPGASVAAVARKHGLNANLLFAWRRLQRRGLLESRRHTPPLLPVTITEPTITPTQRTFLRTRSRRARPAPGDSSAPAQVEIMIGESVRVRLYGEAQQAIVTRVLEWLTPR